MANKDSNSRQIAITKTEGEWAVIMSRLCPEGHDGDIRYLSLHIRKEVAKIKSCIEQMPDDIARSGGKMIKKRPYIDSSILEDIEAIAKSMKVRKSVVIDRLILSPLLK